MLAPIVLFVYNRSWHTEQTLNALMQNELADQSVLYVYADGPKPNATHEELEKIKAVREVVKSRQWCKEVIIIESEKNKGLADSIIEGVTEIVNQYGRIIVLEDDIVTSKGFLTYMNQSLELYHSEEKVMHISGYMYPLKVNLPDTLFLNVVTPWGWGTWKEKWTHFNGNAAELKSRLLALDYFDLEQYNLGYGNEFFNQLEENISERIRTWAVKWHTSIYLQMGYCLHPGLSLVQNIGFDNSGTHCGIDPTYKIDKLTDFVVVNKIALNQKKYILKEFHEFYLRHKYLQSPEPNFLIKLKSFLKKKILNF